MQKTGSLIPPGWLTRVWLRRDTRMPRFRLTLAGWGFCLLVLAGFLMSVNFSNNLIFAMTFLLIGVALVGGWRTYANLRNLALGDWRCEPVFAGQPLYYRLSVVSDEGGHGYGLIARTAANAISTVVNLPPEGEAELFLQRSGVARGVVSPEPVWVCSSFPVGLFLACLEAGQLPSVLVYPAPRGTRPLPDNRAGRQAHRLQESGSFTDMRRYSPGDPPSRIAWQALARTDELYTKTFDGAEGRPSLWLEWEAAGEGGAEERLSQLCRWVLDAHRQGLEYGLRLPGTSIPVGSGEEHWRLCLEALALYGQSPVIQGKEE